MPKKNENSTKPNDTHKGDRKNLSLPLNNTTHGNDLTHNATELGSPVGEGLVGLRYIDDTGSEENLLDFPKRKAKPENDESVRLMTAQDAIDAGLVITSQPPPGSLRPSCPPELEFLLDTGQLVVHLGNFRQEEFKVNEGAPRRMEVIDETRKVLLHVEQDDPEEAEKSSFRFRMYNQEKQEVIQVYSPKSSTCICCGASWHSLKRCRFQAIVYTPVGTVAGFVRRSRTRFVQEFEILNSNEERLLILRGGPQDVEIYIIDHQDELGRLSVHGWAGIMHEVRRTSGDY